MRLYYLISDSLNFIALASLCLFVFFKTPKKKLYLTFALWCGSVAFWAFFHFLWVFFNDAYAVPFGRLLMLGAIWIPTFFYHYVTVLVGKEDSQRSIIRTSYVLSCALTPFDLTSNLFISHFAPQIGLKFYPIAGLLFHVHLLMFCSILVKACVLLFRGIGEHAGKARMQLMYSFVATLIAYGGGMMNYLPCYNIGIKAWGDIFVSFYAFIVGYAILRHHLMDITIVLRKSLVYAFMTAVLTAIYVVIVTQSAQAFHVPGSSLLYSVVAACFIAAVFHPLQVKVQTFVDRHFFWDWVDREAIREVAAGFSHELKSPLAALAVQAEQALADLKDVEDGRELWLKALPKIKVRLEGLLGKTMDAARRIEAVRGVAEPARDQLESVEIKPVLDNSLINVSILLSDGEVKVKQNLPVNLPAVHSNAKQLEIVFANLIKNALEAMNSGQAIDCQLTLSAYEQNGFVLISVKDSGPGIHPNDWERVFEPYYSTKVGRGIGMGLYLSRQIIKAHDGDIDVRSDKRAGTEFMVRLPKYALKVHSAT